MQKIGTMEPLASYGRSITFCNWSPVIRFLNYFRRVSLPKIVVSSNGKCVLLAMEVKLDYNLLSRVKQ